MTAPLELHEDAPACWSWPPLPPLTREQEIERLVAENEHVPPNWKTPRNVIELMTVNWEVYQFDRWHADRCAICGRTASHLVDDHDHRTGLLRGYLCRSCNVREGKCDDGPFPLYRERNPASILGLRSYYVGYGWPARWWENLALARHLTSDPDWTPLVADQALPQNLR